MGSHLFKILPIGVVSVEEACEPSKERWERTKEGHWGVQYAHDHSSEQMTTSMPADDGDIEFPRGGGDQDGNADCRIDAEIEPWGVFVSIHGSRGGGGVRYLWADQYDSQ
jgi:hypothetical protein